MKERDFLAEKREIGVDFLFSPPLQNVLSESYFDPKAFEFLALFSLSIWRVFISLGWKLSFSSQNKVPSLSISLWLST